MKKIKIICAVIWFSLMASFAFVEDTQPLQLTIKSDKESYKEGDTITVVYTIENVSEKPVGFFERGKFKKRLHFAATNKDGEPLETYSLSTQGMMGVLGDYVVLQPGEKLEGREELGTVVFDEVKDYTIAKSKFLMAGYAIKKVGFMLQEAMTYLFLPEPFEGKFLVLAKYRCDDPNSQNFDFSKEECEEIISAAYKPYDPFSHTEFFEMERTDYCQEYEQRTKPAFVGDLESNALTIILDIDKFKDGIVKAYYEDGNVRSERTYKNAVLNGTTKYYYQGYYHNPSSDPTFYEYSPVYGTRNYKDAQLEGKAEDFYKNGQVAYRWHFKDGRLNGEAVWYADDGTLIEKAHYKDGALDGLLQQYAKDGTTSYSAHFKEGKLHGKETYCFPEVMDIMSHADDCVKREGNYKNGKKEGFFNTYYKNNQLKTQHIYENDTLVGERVYDSSGTLVFDYDYHCDKDSPIRNCSFMPTEAKMFFKRVEVNDEGVLIVIHDTFKEQYKTSSVFLSEHFEGNRLFIPRDADLRNYRLEGLFEDGDFKNYAFIAAYPERDKSENTINVYFGRFEDDRAVFLVEKLQKSHSPNAFDFVTHLQVNIDTAFESVKKCGKEVEK